MKKSPNILLTSAGRRGQLLNWLKKTTGPGGKVLVSEISALAPTVYLADGWLKVPKINSDNYIQTLKLLCKNNEVNLVIPTIDTELEILSKYREDFLEIGATLLISSPEAIEITNNKRSTHEWLISKNYPVPKQEIILKEEKISNSIKFPAIKKPIYGSRSVGVIKLDQLSDFTSMAMDEDFLIEEFVEGEEFTVSTYVNSKGKCLAAVPRQRLEVRDGEVSKSVTRNVPEIEILCKSIVENLPGAWGPINIQVIRNPDTGQLWVIEINARFGGGDPLAWVAGADMPAWAIAESLGQPINFSGTWKKDLAMLRFDDAVFTTWTS